jgi:V/A-type H+-transporting ATPase subunit E
VRQIEAEIAKRVEEIQAEERERVEAIRKEAQEDGSRRAEDRQKKDMATAELELRKAHLAQKQELIQQVFDKALKRLRQLKGKEYQRFIAELLLKVVEIGDEEIIFSSADGHKVEEKLLEEVNSRLVGMGKKGNLHLVEENRDLQGGFILRRGKMEVNCSFDTLFNTVREELEPEVAEILFS